jgi:hypothetical protein
MYVKRKRHSICHPRHHRSHSGTGLRKHYNSAWTSSSQFWFRWAEELPLRVETFRAAFIKIWLKQHPALRHNLRFLMQPFDFGSLASIHVSWLLHLSILALTVSSSLLAHCGTCSQSAFAILIDRQSQIEEILSLRIHLVRKRTAITQIPPFCIWFTRMPTSTIKRRFQWPDKFSMFQQQPFGTWWRSRDICLWVCFAIPKEIGESAPFETISMSRFGQRTRPSLGRLRDNFWIYNNQRKMPHFRL